MNNKETNKPLVRVEVMLLIGAFFVILMPYILTRESIFGIEFNNVTGVIGDTIGGITAPFVGIIGAYLVYKSFKVQVETNKEQFRALINQQELAEKSNNYSTLQYLIRISYESLDYISLNNGDKTYRGKELIFYYANNSDEDLNFLKYMDKSTFFIHANDFASKASKISLSLPNSEHVKLTSLSENNIIIELNYIIEIIDSLINLAKLFKEDEDHAHLSSMKEMVQENLTEIAGPPFLNDGES